MKIPIKRPWIPWSEAADSFSERRPDAILKVVLRLRIAFKLARSMHSLLCSRNNVVVLAAGLVQQDVGDVEVLISQDKEVWVV